VLLQLLIFASLEMKRLHVARTQKFQSEVDCTGGGRGLRQQRNGLSGGAAMG
jgi:hypothetical protein